MYKDKDRQREANREAMRRNRAKGASVISCDTRLKVIPEDTPIVILCEAEPERTAQGNIRVSKPGDDDYVPQCETTRAFIEDRPKRPEPKRGKDIKVFADLPPDVQVIINSMSEVDGKIDPKAKADRTEAAIMYQHLFPNRYYSAGVA